MSAHTRELIIESPGLQRPLPRGAWAIVSALFWFAWFWLWLPILSIVGWTFGVYTVLDQFVTRWGYIELLRLLPYYLLVIGTSGLVLIGWSLLQYHRFHGKERRRGFPVVTRADIAEGLGLAPETTVPWVSARRMVAYHDENGRVSWVDIGDGAAAAKSAESVQSEAVAAVTEVASSNEAVSAATEPPVETVPAPLRLVTTDFQRYQHTPNSTGLFGNLVDKSEDSEKHFIAQNNRGEVKAVESQESLETVEALVANAPAQPMRKPRPRSRRAKRASKSAKPSQGGDPTL